MAVADFPKDGALKPEKLGGLKDDRKGGDEVAGGLIPRSFGLKLMRLKRERKVASLDGWASDVLDTVSESVLPLSPGNGFGSGLTGDFGASGLGDAMVTGLALGGL